jgi:hypothetical protein
MIDIQELPTGIDRTEAHRSKPSGSQCRRREKLQRREQAKVDG